MRVLVTAASKHEATREIAEMITARLRGHRLDAMHLEPGEVDDLAGVDAVVLGSAVYAGRWMEPARSLVDRLGPQLAERRVWLFSSGPIGDPPKPVGDPIEIAELLTTTGAEGHRVFAGRLDRDRLGLGERAVVRALRAPEGDFRDVDDITGWADAIAGVLRAHAATTA